jgi:hypothetical protein
MSWIRVKEVGSVPGGGSRLVRYESGEAGGLDARGVWVEQILEERPEKIYLTDEVTLEQGDWASQEMEAREKRDFCPEVAQEVADAVYHEGLSRPVRRVAWDLCDDRPDLCGVLPAGWGPGSEGVPTPTIFLQSNPVMAENCLPLNRLVRGVGPAAWIAHLKNQGSVVANFAQGNEVLMFVEFDGAGSLAGVLLTGLWSPADIATGLWLDAADEATVTLTLDGLVSQWVDRSGNGVVVDQTSNLLRPTYDGQIGGVKALNFLGSNEFLEARSYVKSPGFYIILVAKHDLSLPDAPVFSYFDSNNSNERVNLRSRSGRSSMQVISRGVNEGDGDTEGFFLYDLPGMGQGFVLSMSDTGGAGSFINYNANQKVASGSLGSERLLGLRIANSVGAAGSLGGALGEFILLDQVPDADTQRRLEGYLAHKWGIAGQIPEDHPYKVNPPTPRAG